MKKQKLNRILAREILILFLSIIFIGLIFIFLLLRNEYFDNKIQKLSKKSHQLNHYIDGYSSNRIKFIYETLNPYFIENYKINNDKFAVPKFEEKSFLNRHPNAEHLDIYPEGYSFFKLNSIITSDGSKIKYKSLEELGRAIKNKYDAYNDMEDKELGGFVLKKYQSQPDSIIIFDYLELDQFRKFMAIESYRNKIFSAFSDSIDFGAKTKFNNDVFKSLNIPKSITTLGDSLFTEEININRDINKTREKVLDFDTIVEILNSLSFVIFIILYPLRLSYYIIRWSIKTLKK